MATAIQPIAAPCERSYGGHVGIGYLAQLCLTSGPLMFADLALLATVILVPKYIMEFFGTSPEWICPPAFCRSRAVFC